MPSVSGEDSTHLSSPAINHQLLAGFHRLTQLLFCSFVAQHFSNYIVLATERRLLSYFYCNQMCSREFSRQSNSRLTSCFSFTLTRMPKLRSDHSQGKPHLFQKLLKYPGEQVSSRILLAQQECVRHVVTKAHFKITLIKNVIPPLRSLLSVATDRRQCCRRSEP